MRRSQGSLSSFCSAGPPSLAPRPRPPYFVAVGSEVLRYESYWNGQFWPHTLGSMVSSVTSTTRTKACRASCLRSKMLVSRDRRSTVSPATARKPRDTSHQFRRIGPPPAPEFTPGSAPGAMARAGMTVQTVELAPARSGARGHRLQEGAVAAHAVVQHDAPVVGRDLDWLLEILQGERDRVPEPVVGLGQPLDQALVRQVTLDAGGGVPVAALEPGVVLLVHDVTVHAGPRIGGEIGEALGVHEGEGADAGRDAEEDGHQYQARRQRHQDASPFDKAPSKLIFWGTFAARFFEETWAFPHELFDPDQIQTQCTPEASRDRRRACLLGPRALEGAQHEHLGLGLAGRDG